MILKGLAVVAGFARKMTWHRVRNPWISFAFRDSAAGHLRSLDLIRPCAAHSGALKAPAPRRPGVASARPAHRISANPPNARTPTRGEFAPGA